MSNNSGHHALQLGVIDYDCVTPVDDHCMTSHSETNRSNEFMFEEEELDDIFDLPTPQHFWSDSDEACQQRFSDPPSPLTFANLSQPIDDNLTNQILQTVPRDLQLASPSFCSHALEAVYKTATDPIEQLPTDRHHTTRLGHDIPSRLPTYLEETTAPSAESRSNPGMSRARQTTTPFRNPSFASQPTGHLLGQSQLAKLTEYSDSDVDEDSDLDQAPRRVERPQHERPARSRQSSLARPMSLSPSYQGMGAADACFLLNIDYAVAGKHLDDLEELVELMIYEKPGNEAKYREAHAAIMRDHGHDVGAPQKAHVRIETTRTKADNDKRQLQDDHGSARRCPIKQPMSMDSKRAGVPASLPSDLNAIRQVQRLKPPSLSVPDQPSTINQKKRPLTPSATAHTMKSKRQQRRRPFEMSSGSESEELLVPPEKPLSRRLNLGRLKQAMANNGAHAFVKLAKENTPPSAIRGKHMFQAGMLGEVKRNELSPEARECKGNTLGKKEAKVAPLMPVTTANPAKKLAIDPSQAVIDGLQGRSKRSQDQEPSETAQNPRTARVVNAAKASRQPVLSTMPSNLNGNISGVVSKATSNSDPPNRTINGRSAPPIQSNAIRASVQSTRTNQHGGSIAASRITAAMTLDKQIPATTKSPEVKETDTLVTIASTGNQKNDPSSGIPVSSVLKNILTEASAPTAVPKAEPKVAPNATSVANTKLQNGSTGRTARTPPDEIRKASAAKPPTADNGQKTVRKVHPTPTSTPTGKTPDAITAKMDVTADQGVAQKLTDGAKEHTGGDSKNTEGAKPSKDHASMMIESGFYQAECGFKRLNAVFSEIRGQPISETLSTELDKQPSKQAVAKTIQHKDTAVICKPPQIIPKALGTKVTEALRAVGSPTGSAAPISTQTDKSVELPTVVLRNDLVTLPPDVETEAYFEYSIFQKLCSDSEKEDEVKPTELTGRMLTSIDEANRRAEKLFTDTNKQYATYFPVQFQGSSTKRNENDCMSLSATFAPIDFPSKKSHLKIWVERHFVSAHAAAVQTPLQHTPFISKTLYILRLHKLIENPAAHTNSDTEMASSSDSSNSEPESDSDPNKGKHKKKEKLKAHAKEPKPQKSKPQRYIHQHHPLPCTEVYTTLDAANCAARRLQIEMSHDKDPSSQAKEKWQEQNARELTERVQSLNLGMGGKEGYWRSEFNESKLGGDRFELVVEKVGLCGPRNV